MKWMKGKKKETFRRYPLLTAVFLSVILGVLCVAFFLLTTMNWVHMSIQNMGEFLGEAFLLLLSGGPMVGLFFILPLLLTGMEGYYLYKKWKKKDMPKELRHIDLTVLFLGTIYNYVLLGLVDSVSFGADWYETLYNTQKHTPIFTASYLIVAIVFLIAIIGYLIVSTIPVGKVPPLLFVLGMSGMYLGVLLSVLFAVQTFRGNIWLDGYLLLLPICVICVTARCVLEKMDQWNAQKQEKNNQWNAQEQVKNNQWNIQEQGKGNQWNAQEQVEAAGNKEWIGKKCTDILSNASYWPLAAFLLMWPLLGIIMGVLILFGQEPDAFMKAWTETSDWNLSQRVAPQNIYQDEHYLCTVAAGGHEKVVKPIRLGVRHGHEVIVNRQLCVANAFEQVLEEKTPHFHKLVRGAYDKYGFPVARLIKSQWIADGIYILMKPLELMFLIVLYLVDVNPENRIAVQYTGKKMEEIKNLVGDIG